MPATQSPTLELPFEVIELPRNAALVPHETPWIDLSSREIEGDEFGPLALAAVAIAAVTVVAVVAIVTDTNIDINFQFGPIDYSVSIY